MMPYCANIPLELVLNAADVLSHMLRAHWPGIIYCPASSNTKANSFNYLIIGKIKSEHNLSFHLKGIRIQFEKSETNQTTQNPQFTLQQNLPTKSQGPSF
jgi:hypothetical protein